MSHVVPFGETPQPRLLLSLVTPAFNEAENLPALYRRLGAALAHAREVDVVLNGQVLGSPNAQPARTWQHLGPLTLHPGPNGLMFRPRQPAVVADTVAHNGDPRPLSIAVWNWKWTEAPTVSAHR